MTFMRRPTARQLASSRKLLFLGAGVAALLGLSGCQVVDVGSGNYAQVRFIQASQNAPGIDFYANGTALAYNVGFGQGTSYVPVSPAAYTVNADSAGTKTALATASQGMAAGQQYTVILGGTLATLQQTILTDQTTAAPSGNISVRLLDEATKVSGVDVYLVSSSSKLSATGLISNFTNLSYGSNSGYVNVPAGTYSIVVVPTGTVPTSTTTTLLTGTQLGYNSGSVRTVVIMDAPNGVSTPGVAAYVAVDYDSPAA
jgi:hypothetical protein